MKSEQRWRLWVEGDMAGSSAPLSVIWRPCVEPSCSVPGQDLSLLPTSFPCTAAKPTLGKGLNFGSGCPLFPTLCHYAAQIEKTAHWDGGGWRKMGLGPPRVFRGFSLAISERRNGGRASDVCLTC